MKILTMRTNDPLSWKGLSSQSGVWCEVAGSSLLYRCQTDYNVTVCLSSIPAWPKWCKVALALKDPTEIVISGEVVRRARAGDAVAIEQLVVKFDPLLKCLCCAKIGWPDGEDLAQKIWIEKLNKLDTFDGVTIEDFRKFLLRDICGRSIDYHRTKSRLPQQMPNDLEGKTLDVIDPSISFVDELEAREFLESQIKKVKECIRKHLDDRMIRYLRMRYLEGYEINAIAEIAGMDNSNGSLTKKIQRALARVKKCVQRGQS